jgi:hypothetical protein
VPLARYGVPQSAVPTDGDNDGSNTGYYLASQIFRFRVGEFAQHQPNAHAHKRTRANARHTGKLCTHTNALHAQAQARAHTCLLRTCTPPSAAPQTILRKREPTAGGRWLRLNFCTTSHGLSQRDQVLLRAPLCAVENPTRGRLEGCATRVASALALPIRRAQGALLLQVTIINTMTRW